MNNRWKFLDDTDLNAIYAYVGVLNGDYRRISVVQFEYYIDKYVEENDKLTFNKIDVCQNCYYIIWYAYRYILKCKTLKEAKMYADSNTIEALKLGSIIRSRKLFICNDCNLYFAKESEMPVILEILYGRYDLKQQLNCYANGIATCKRTKLCREYIEKIRSTEEYLEKEEEKQKLEKSCKNNSENDGSASGILRLC